MTGAEPGIGVEDEEASKLVTDFPAAFMLILTAPVCGRVRAPRNVWVSSPQTSQGLWDCPSLLPVLSHVCFSPGDEERAGARVLKVEGQKGPWRSPSSVPTLP